MFAPIMAMSTSGHFSSLYWKVVVVLSVHKLRQSCCIMVTVYPHAPFGSSSSWACTSFPLLLRQLYEISWLVPSLSCLWLCIRTSFDQCLGFRSTFWYLPFSYMLEVGSKCFVFSCCQFRMSETHCSSFRSTTGIIYTTTRNCSRTLACRTIGFYDVEFFLFGILGLLA